MIRGNVIYDVTKLNNIWPKFVVNLNTIADGAVLRVTSVEEIPPGLGSTFAIVEAAGVDPASRKDNAIYGKIILADSIQSYVIHSEYLSEEGEVTTEAPTTTVASGPLSSGWITFNGTTNTFAQEYDHTQPAITSFSVHSINPSRSPYGKFAYIEALGKVVTLSAGIPFADWR
jgi:hypothetical protein